MNNFLEYLRDSSCKHFNVGKLKRILFEEVADLPENFSISCSFRYFGHKYIKESNCELKCMEYLSESTYDGSFNNDIVLKGYNKSKDKNKIYVYEYKIIPNDKGILVELNCKSKDTFVGLINKKYK